MSNNTLRSTVNTDGLMMKTPEVFAKVSPNPFVDNGMITYHIDNAANINISLVNAEGQQIKMLVSKNLKAGTYTEKWNGSQLSKGIYFIKIAKDGEVKQTIKVVKGNL